MVTAIFVAVSAMFLSLLLLLAFLPCLLGPDLLPGQDFPGSEWDAGQAVAGLRALAESERHFYAANGRYTRIGDLPQTAKWPIRDPAHRYTIAITTVGAIHFEAIAGPYYPASRCCCLLGIDTRPDFYIDESGVVRVDRHCRVANRSSPPFN